MIGPRASSPLAASPLAATLLAAALLAASPLAVGCSGTGASTGVALIKMSRSTNSPEVDVSVYGDGSADRTVGTPPGVLNVASKSYPPGSPDVATFLADLAAARDVSTIPTASCVKSASFGTTTTLVAGGKTSGDLQCLASPSAPVAALAHDCEALLGTASP